MSLPEVVNFEDVQQPGGRPGKRTLSCYYRKIATRPPMKGEWYLSGAVPMAYRAKNDMTTNYLIVVPTHYAVPATGWAKGGPVPL